MNNNNEPSCTCCKVHSKTQIAEVNFDYELWLAEEKKKQEALKPEPLEVLLDDGTWRESIFYTERDWDSLEELEGYPLLRIKRSLARPNIYRRKPQ